MVERGDGKRTEKKKERTRMEVERERGVGARREVFESDESRCAAGGSATRDGELREIGQGEFSSSEKLFSLF